MGYPSWVAAQVLLACNPRRGLKVAQMNIAFYRDVEVRSFQLPDGTGLAQIHLPSGTGMLDGPSEARAISKAKVMIEKDHLGILDPSTD